MAWKEQKLKALDPQENADIVGSISAQTITSIYISELTQVKEIESFRWAWVLKEKLFNYDRIVWLWDLYTLRKHLIQRVTLAIWQLCKLS